MSNIRSLIKGAFVYGVGDVLLFGISYLIMIPLLTRYLSPEEYGVVATLNTLSVFLLAFFQLGLPSAAFRFWFLQTNPSQQKSYMTSMMVTTVVLTAVLASGILWLGQPIWEAWVARAPFDEFAPYIIIGAVLQVIIAFKSVLLRALDRPRLFITLDICQFLTMLLVVAYQIVVLHNGVIGQIRGVFYTQVIFAVIGFGVIISICGIRFRAEGIVRSLRFAWPVLVGGLVSLLATRSSILITQYYVTGAAVGLFALGSQIGSLVHLAGASIEKAWQPFLYSRNPDQARVALRGILDLAVPAYTLMTMILALFAPEVVKILASNQYESAWVVAGIASFGALCVALSSIANGGLYYATRSGLSMLVTTVAAGANLFLCWLLIPRWGIVGAATATAVSGVVSLTFMLVANRAVFDKDITYYRIFGTVLLGVCLTVAASLAYLQPSFSETTVWVVKCIAIIIYGAVIWKLKWFHRARLAFKQPAVEAEIVVASRIVEPVQ